MIEMSEKHPRFVTLLFSVVVLAITLALFSEVLHNNFVRWDDDIMILNNPKLTGLDLHWAFTDVDSTMSYNHLTLISWQLTYLVNGFSPFWFHFGNWLLHGLSALLLFLCLREMLAIAFAREKHDISTLSPFSRDFAAAAAALLWSVHPLRVEPVAWASTRAYCLAVFFLLCSFYLYLKSHRARVKNASRSCLAFSVIFYVASLLSLPLGTAFFIVLLMVDIFFLKTINFSDTGGRWGSLRRVLAGKLLFALPAAGIAVAAVVIRYTSHVIWETPVDLSQFGLLPRLMQAFYQWAYFVWKPLYPVNLSPIYTTLFAVDPASFPFVASAVLVGGVSLAVLLLRERLPFLIGIWTSYLVLMLPFLGFFEHPYFSSDRYSLHSSLCLSVLAAILIVRAIHRVRPWKIAAVVISVLALLGWMTLHQERIWRNTETLLTHMIRTLGNDPYRTAIWGRLGENYMQTGQPDKAISAFNEVLNVKPANVAANSRLAALYLDKNMFTKALDRCRAIVSRDPDNREAHYEMGVILTKLNRRGEAKYQFDLAERPEDLQREPARP